MIWSEHHNFCFIHIPKTGGSAITVGYAQAMNFGDVVLGGTPFAEELSQIYRTHLGVHKHSFARKVAEVVGAERFRQSFSFAVLRDPMARLVSYYRWLQSKKADSNLNDEQQLLKQCATFKEFVEEASRIFVPQVNYVQDASGTVMISELFVYERLAQDWPRISSKMGISVALPVANKSRKLHVEINSAIENIVRERYLPDFELLERIQALS